MDLTIIAKIHPMLIHFPIAFLIVGVLSDLIKFIKKSESEHLRLFGLYSTTIGVISLLPAIITGMLAHTFQAPPNINAESLMNIHERLAYLLLLLFSIITIWRWDSNRSNLNQLPLGYIILTILGLFMLIIVAFAGGELVYNYGMGVSKSILIQN